jgi:CheY-like chemotaxis protein
VLVAEDDGGVRPLLGCVLRDLGYTVLLAADGLEAVRVGEEFPGRIHLVVADVSMPGLGGRKAVERLAVPRPGLRWLFITGHDDELARHGIPDPWAGVLRKPFGPAEFARRVRDALDRQASIPSGVGGGQSP